MYTTLFLTEPYKAGSQFEDLRHTSQLPHFSQQYAEEGHVIKCSKEKPLFQKKCIHISVISFFMDNQIYLGAQCLELKLCGFVVCCPLAPLPVLDGRRKPKEQNKPRHSREFLTVL